MPELEPQDAIDQLLAKLQGEDAAGQSQPQVTPPQPVVTSSNLPAGSPSVEVDAIAPFTSPTSLEDLLGSLGEERRQAVQEQLSLSRLAPTFPAAPTPAQTPLLTPDIAPSLLVLGKAEQSLLTNLQAEYAERDQQLALQQERERQEAERRQRQAEAERQKRLEAMHQQRRAELREVAQKWLKQLKPRSKEGRWFEEFACSYPSRLDAAIEYLEALQSLD